LVKTERIFNDYNSNFSLEMTLQEENINKNMYLHTNWWPAISRHLYFSSSTVTEWKQRIVGYPRQGRTHVKLSLYSGESEWRWTNTAWSHAEHLRVCVCVSEIMCYTLNMYGLHTHSIIDKLS